MTALADFSKRYGAIMTAYVLLGCGIWLIGLIVLPQLLMIEKSVLYTDRAATALVSQTRAATDRLFVEQGRLERRLAQIDKALAGDGAQSGSGGAASGAFSPFGAQNQAAKSPDELRAEKTEAEARLNAITAEIAANDKLVAETAQAAEPRYGIANYTELFTNDANRPIFWKTIWASIMVTLVALVVCYPVAFYLAKSAPKETTALLMLALVVPYWVNEILRTFAWLMLLSSDGIVNQALQATGLASGPIDWREGNAAVLIGMTYAYILFMVFPIYNTIDTLDTNQVEAARDLGAPWWLIHWTIVIPHAKPGIAVGCIMTFMLAAGSYAVPVMLGSTTSKWFTEIIYDQFYEGGDWSLGSAYAFVLLFTCIVFIMLMMRLFKVSLQDIAK